MKKDLNYLSLLIICILLLAGAFHAGTLVGFHEGTNLSLVLAAASIEHEKAIGSSITLGLLKENKQEKALSFLESRFRNSVNSYYRYLEYEKDVKKLLDDNYIKSRLNAFTPLQLGPLKAPAYYVRNHIPKNQIMENKGFQLLLEEHPEKPNKSSSSVE